MDNKECDIGSSRNTLEADKQESGGWFGQLGTCETSIRAYSVKSSESANVKRNETGIGFWSTENQYLEQARRMVSPADYQKLIYAKAIAINFLIPLTEQGIGPSSLHVITLSQYCLPLEKEICRNVPCKQRLAT